MNDVQRSAAAKVMVAQMLGDLDPDTVNKEAALLFKMALIIIRQGEELTELAYSKRGWRE